MEQNNVRYLCPIESCQEIQSQRFKSCLNCLQDLMPNGSQLSVFPEATIKTNYAPNGILIEQPHHCAQILPDLLRDPGCGFLLFELEQPKVRGWKEITLHFLETDFYANRPTDPEHLLDFLANGVKSLGDEIDLCKFHNVNFDIDPAVLAMVRCHIPLLESFNQLSNTIEIKTIGGTDNKRLQGFIHSGSESGAALIKHLYHSFLTSRECQHLFNFNQYNNNRLTSLSFNSEAGQIFYQMCLVVMNLSLVNRALIFNRLKHFFRRELNCELVMQNDLIHAGIFVDGERDKTIRIARGVQKFSSRKYHNFNKLLVAGHLEGPAMLCTRGDSSNYLAHGTSYDESQIDAEKFLPYSMKCKVMQSLKHQVSNSDIDMTLAYPHTYNIVVYAEYLQRTQAVESLQFCYPLLNFQSPLLQKRLAYHARPATAH